MRMKTMRGRLLFRPPIALHGLVAGLPAVAIAGDATTAPVIGHGHGRSRRQLGRIGRKRRAVVASVGPIDRRRSHNCGARRHRSGRSVFISVGGLRGLSNKDIASILNLAEGTVKIHVAALLRKLGVHRRAAVAVAGGVLIGAR